MKLKTYHRYTVNVSYAKRPKWLLELMFYLSIQYDQVVDRYADDKLDEMKRNIDFKLVGYLSNGDIKSDVYTEMVEDDGTRKIHVFRNNRPVLICWFE